MKTKQNILSKVWLAMALVVLFLSGCDVLLPVPEPTPTLFLLPTAPPTESPPTSIAENVTPTDDDSTQPSPGPLLTVPPDETPGVTCTLDGVFVEDVTIPDNTAMRVNEPFTKTWRMQNIGSCTWGPGYYLVFLTGESFGNFLPIPIPVTPAGATVDLSIELMTPGTADIFLGFWRLQAPDGTLFGTEAYIQIITFNDSVNEPTQSVPTLPPTPTTSSAATSPPVRTATPTATGSNKPTPTRPATQVADTESNCTYNSAFVADVTIPDDTVVQPGDVFTKTWRIRNNGSCNWGSNVQLVFLTGTQMTSGASVGIPDTPAGGTSDISITISAPSAAGTYTSIWRLQTTGGKQFGTRPYVRFVVAGATPTPSIGSGNPPPGNSGSSAVNNLTARARSIYLEGQRQGNNPRAFAKVGDSITTQHYFLVQIGDGSEILHEYSYLSPVISQFRVQLAAGGNSFDRGSFAARGGWDSNAIFDKSLADTACVPDTPLDCEYKKIKPSVAIIMIGTNDSELHIPMGVYEANLRRMIETSISYGVIPVLSTIPWNKFRDPGPFNQIVIRLALEYSVPWMDYHRLMEQAPNRGLSGDQVHPSVPPDDNTANFSDSNLQYGYTIRNLLTVQTLDAIWRQVMY